MQKVLKKFCSGGTNDRLDVNNIHQSKFRQLMTRMHARTLMTDRMQPVVLRTAKPCSYCTARGIVVSKENGNYHERRSSKRCNPVDTTYVPEKNKRVKHGISLDELEAAERGEGAR